MDNTRYNYNIWLKKAQMLYNIQQQRRAIEKVEKELSDQLKRLQFNESFTFAGIRYFYEERKGGINYHNIPELKGVNLEQYREPSVKVWKLAVDSI